MSKTILFILLTIIIYVVYCMWTFCVQPDLASDLALSQLERSNIAASQLRSYQWIHAYKMVYPTGLVVLLGLGIYKDNIVSLFNKIVGLIKKEEN